MGNSAEMANVRVRVARAGDVQELAELCTQLGYSATPAEIMDRMERILGDTDHVVFVAEGEGARLAGFLHGYSGMVLADGLRATILGLVVDGSLRGKRIGHKLVGAAEEWARSKGHHSLDVRCNVVRTAAHKFYEGLGFECTKTQKHYRKKL